MNPDCEPSLRVTGASGVHAVRVLTRRRGTGGRQIEGFVGDRCAQRTKPGDAKRCSAPVVYESDVSRPLWSKVCAMSLREPHKDVVAQSNPTLVVGKALSGTRLNIGLYNDISHQINGGQLLSSYR